MADRLITVKAKPKARDRSLKVVRPDYFEIRTNAPPDKDKANEDIVDILADHLDVPKSCITLVRGRTSRTKTFKITA